MGRRMSRVIIACALALCVLVTPVPAGAQEGNGPYAPFPSAAEGASGDAWYALMDADIPSARLADGAFAGELKAAAAATPVQASTRAGVDVAGTGPGPLAAALALALLAAAAAALTALLRHRREARP